ncbi:MAG: hypothetical protein KatS3mg060_2045 [Dehalococcoidia bacterium]|nr:MAG: hypothetical protein KatS3mg060_2045 [Dehalococcoidia bacterium]
MVFEVDRRDQGLAASVYLEDLLAPVDVRPVQHDLPVEPARPQERRVENVRPVGGRR